MGRESIMDVISGEGVLEPTPEPRPSPAPIIPSPVEKKKKKRGYKWVNGKLIPY